MTEVINYRFRVAGYPASGWTTGTVLRMRELGLELDTGKVKLGDGATDWGTLGYHYFWSKWGRLAGTLSDQTDLQAALNAKANSAVGSWTPGISFGGAAVGATYGTANAGAYAKIGRLVFVSGLLQLTAKGSSTGAARLTGLPFAVTVPGFSSPALGLYANITGVTTPLFLDMETGTAGAIYTTPVSALNDGHFADNTTIEFAFCYLAAS